MYLGDGERSSVMTQPMILMIGILVVSIIMLICIFAALSPGDSAKRLVDKRLDKIRDKHQTSQDALTRAKMRKIASLQQNRLDGIATRFLPRPEELRLRLTRTGKPWTMGQYGAASVGCFLLFAAAALVLLKLPAILALLVGLLAGFGLPHLVVSVLIGKRLRAFLSLFPDAIDLMVRGLRSGLPITESLNVVGREIADPVGVEFRLVADKIRIGQTMEQALQDVAKRINTPEFQFFVISLAIQRETGGNLAETLSNLSDVLRKRQQIKLKIRAMSSESKASAYIIGSLPFIMFVMISLINSQYMAGFFTDTRLIIAAFGGLVWMGIGVGIMAKMINFDY
jgi:tight adherence protein B